MKDYILITCYMLTTLQSLALIEIGLMQNKLNTFNKYRLKNKIYLYNYKKTKRLQLIFKLKMDPLLYLIKIA